MLEKRSYSTRKILANVLWAVLGIAVVVLLSAAIIQKNNRKCKGAEVNISGVQNNFFIDKKQVIDMLESINGAKLEDKRISSFDLAAMENTLRTNEWIKNAELYFDNNEILVVKINEREPVARVFTKNGSSFYIDGTVKILPLSDRSSARVPVFTNFPSANTLSGADSNLLSDMRTLGSYILNNEFWMAQIDQVDISPGGTFEMIPKMGNHIILFGNAENYREKFEHLLTFYKEVMPKTGWNKYSKIDVRYTNEIVAVKRNAQDVLQDSLKAKQLMQAIVASSLKQATDTMNTIQLPQPQDENPNPLPPQSENVPEDEFSTGKPSASHTTLPVLNENLTPAIKKIVSKPPQKNTHLAVQPVLSSKAPVKKSPGHTTFVPGKKSLPVTSKKTMKPIIQSTIKPKTKPKTTPNNDY